MCRTRIGAAMVAAVPKDSRILHFCSRREECNFIDVQQDAGRQFMKVVRREDQKAPRRVYANG